MRKNLPVTQREIPIPDGMRLISTTNLKGVITYCDDDFVSISGFNRDELIGQAHNLIRHPDMPPAVFADMWAYLKAGKAWMGVVKNRAKSGDHYWVSAYVTPIREGDDIVGYESVRVAASRDQVARAERLYRKLSQGRLAPSWCSKGLSILRSGWPMALPLAASLVALVLDSPVLAVLLVVIGHALGFSMIFRSFSRRIERLLALRQDAFQDPLVARTYSDERGLMSRLALVLLSEDARIRTALARIDDQAEQLLEQARASHRYISEGAAAIARQRAETDQTASAIHEMTVSIQEVVEALNHNAQETEQARCQAHEGAERSGEALGAIEQLVTQVQGIGESVGKLGQSTQSIGEAADLISAIADQTNLLALNAAIEAARAGEQGRGFAVVADEVRSLAQRTRESTLRINEVVEVFRAQVGETVEATEAGEKVAVEGLSRVQGAVGSLNAIVGSVDRISESFITMSAAFEEQSQVSEEINQQVVNIATLADQSDEQAGSARESSDMLSRMALGLKELVARFVNKTG
ncbi:methyl-accepting chemotaxis protein [Marinobacter daepoensis]|uniref:methyl-accepting chemotaxis protein n=1 Tax=Marinobacter daepoensis TaxID=262077 RepID=UPI001C93EAA6|nr:PAS domain-containing methyl-accepting chemotaxis protein [Marinobacter daepoensis]MBY6032777.1 methyl-accepting chemotaxis protein [Marinobacter daepoensis]